MSEVDVSVYILTYYHEKYIRRAIDSVLSQKTSYKYEIVISDDCSKDSTIDILKEYEQKFPGVIRVNYNRENLGIPQNIYIARTMCRGKYIVLLAGDDYWINDNKIQMQTEFLENNPNYVAVCTRLEVRKDENEFPEVVLPRKDEIEKDYSLIEYQKGYDINTHGLMMRNFFLEEDGRKYFGLARNISEKVDDAVDNFLLVNKGKVYTLNIITDVYRVPSTFVNSHSYGSKPEIEKICNDISLYNNLDRYFGESVNFSRRYSKSVVVILKHIFLDREKHSWYKVYRSILPKYRSFNSKNVILNSIPLVINKLKYRMLQRTHNH